MKVLRGFFPGVRSRLPRRPRKPLSPQPPLPAPIWSLYGGNYKKVLLFGKKGGEWGFWGAYGWETLGIRCETFPGEKELNGYRKGQRGWRIRFDFPPPLGSMAPIIPKPPKSHASSSAWEAFTRDMGAPKNHEWMVFLFSHLGFWGNKWRFGFSPGKGGEGGARYPARGEEGSMIPGHGGAGGGPFGGHGAFVGRRPIKKGAGGWVLVTPVR